MSTQKVELGLIALVADNDAREFLKALLPRLLETGLTAEFTFEIIRHPNRDNGCFSRAADLLNDSSDATHALVLFDKHGSGRESKSREIIEQKVEEDLARSGWARTKVRAIVIDPELENWIWIRNQHLARALSWRDETTLYHWLQRQKAIPKGATKPTPPKEWMIKALKQRNRSHSAAIFNQIAQRVSLRWALHACHDQSFHDLVFTLRQWFPPSLQAAR